MQEEIKPRFVSPLRALIVAVVMVAVIAYLALPCVSPGGRMNSNETSAIFALRSYVGAQSVFVKHNSYKRNPPESLYANPYTDLLEIGYGGEFKDEPNALKLINRDFADACWVPPEPKPRSGYFFLDITAGRNGPFDHKSEFGLCAFPAEHRKTGLKTFIIGVSGKIYHKDNGGRPVTAWPDVAEEGWKPI
ncbi:MAG: DUF2950 family protein [Planctomycetota bacterium]|jgi:hypothetical protein